MSQEYSPRLLSVYSWWEKGVAITEYLFSKDPLKVFLSVIVADFTAVLMKIKKITS